MVDRERADDLRPPRRARAGSRRCASSAGRRRRPRARPAPSADPLRGAGGERALGDRDRREPVAPIRRRRRGSSGASLHQPAPARAACSRCRASPRAAPRGAPRRSACRSAAQRPVRAGVDPRERRVDLAEHVLVVLLERVVDLAVERHGRRVGEMVVDRRLVGLVLERAAFSLVEVVDRADDALPLLEQAAAEALDVDRLIAAPPSRRSASSAAMPRSSTTLSRPRRPATSVTLRAGRSRSASSCRTASFARPRSGAARHAHLPGLAVPADDPVRAGSGRDAKRRRVVGSAIRRQYRSRSLRPPGGLRRSCRRPRARRPRPRRAPREQRARMRGAASSRALALGAASRVIARASAWASSTIASASRLRLVAHVRAAARSAESSVVRSSCLELAVPRRARPRARSTRSARSARSRQTSSKLSATRRAAVDGAAAVAEQAAPEADVAELDR